MDLNICRVNERVEELKRQLVLAIEEQFGKKVKVAFILAVAESHILTFSATGKDQEKEVIRFSLGQLMNLHEALQTHIERHDAGELD